MPRVGDSGVQQCVEKKLVLGRILAKYCSLSSGKTYHCDEVFGPFSSIHVPIYKEWHNLAKLQMWLQILCFDLYIRSG